MKRPLKNSNRIKLLRAKIVELQEISEADGRDIAAKSARISHLEKQLRDIDNNDQDSKNMNSLLRKDNETLKAVNKIHESNARFFQLRINALEVTIRCLNRLSAEDRQHHLKSVDWTKPTQEEVYKLIVDTFKAPLTSPEREAKIADLLGLKKDVVQ